jgi:hypothetical protein
VRYAMTPSDDLAPAARRHGLGALIVTHLERCAVDQRPTRMRLDTRGDLTEARALYGRLGYHEVEPFNDEPDAEHGFEKALWCPVAGDGPSGLQDSRIEAMSKLSSTAAERRRAERDAPARTPDDRTVLVGMKRPATAAELRAFVAREESRIRTERGLPPAA